MRDLRVAPLGLMLLWAAAFAQPLQLSLADLLRAGDAALRRGQWPEAEAKFRAAVELRPDSANARRGLVGIVRH